MSDNPFGLAGYTPSSYGDAFADVYDEWYGGANYYFYGHKLKLQTDALDALLAHSGASTEKHAKYMRDKVIPAMVKLRETGDQIEVLTPQLREQFETTYARTAASKDSVYTTLFPKGMALEQSETLFVSKPKRSARAR